MFLNFHVICDLKEILVLLSERIFDNELHIHAGYFN